MKQQELVASLAPFFSFYGSKWRYGSIDYPLPKYRTIIEPFAGSAGYSTRFHHHDVILCDKDPIIAGLWDYLIRTSSSEILSLPDVPLDGSIADINVCQEARWLIGFWLNRGASQPRQLPSSWMRSEIRPQSFWGPHIRQRIAAQVVHIRHWRVYNCTFEDCRFQGPATWFIDPPYQLQGRHYRHSDIDYDYLAAWCQSRSGQAIVCEGHGANWLPFEEIGARKTTRRRKSKEMLWTSL